MSDKMSGAQEIKRLRVASARSRSEVAADLGLSERHLYRLEYGLSPLTRRWVLVFAQYYDVDPETIEDGNGVPA